MFLPNHCIFTCKLSYQSESCKCFATEITSSNLAPGGCCILQVNAWHSMYLYEFSFMESLLPPLQFPRPPLLFFHVAAGAHIYYSRHGRSRRTEAMDNILTLDIQTLDIYPHVPSLPSLLRGWPRFRVETSQIIFRHNRSRGHVFCLHSTWDFENRESEQNSKLSLVTFSQD